MTTKPNVKSFSVTGEDGAALRLTVSTDIVDYMDSARAFGRENLADAGAHGRFQRRLIAIPDHKGGVLTPMVLSIGNANGLFLVRKESGAAGDGWRSIDLGAALAKTLGGAVQVRAVDAAWSDDDRIAVAVAVDNGDAAAPSRVFVAYDLSSAATDWNAVPWIDCGTRGAVRVSGIRVLDGGENGWVVVLDGSNGRLAALYLLRSKQRRSFAQAPVFNPAVDYQDIFDFQGAVEPETKSPGIVVLGQSGSGPVLSFRPFPEFKDDGTLGSVPPAWPLPCPAGANVLDVGLTRDGGTDLYVGGQGVHLIAAAEISNQEAAAVATIMSPEAAANVSRLSVADAEDGSAAVWALLRNGHLIVTKRAADSGASWGTPLRLRKDVQDVAPVHGDHYSKTSLLAIYADGRASFLLQDASTNTWRDTPLLVANPKAVTPVGCYGTQLRVLEDGGIPRAAANIKVSASALTSVILNGRNVFIGPDLEAEAETDANGGVHLYDRARSLAPAIYRFAVVGVQGVFDVNPAGGIHERLATISANDLRDASVPTTLRGEPKPLLPDEFRTGAKRGEVDGMAAALNQAAKLASNTPSLHQGQPGSAFSSALKAGAVPENYAWGIHADSSGVRPASADAVARTLSLGENVERFFVDLGDSIADFFEGLWDRIKQGWTFVVRKVQDAFEFICSLGDKVKKFVLKTLEEIGSFFTWLWEQVKTGLEKVWNFLKFVFNWDDILVARDAMVQATDEALKYLKASTTMLEAKTREGFDHAIKEVRRWQSEVGVPPVTLPRPAPGTSFSSQFKQAGEPAHDLLDQATGNSVIGWVMDRLNGIFDEIVHIEGEDPGKVAIDTAKNFLTGLIDDEYNDLKNLWDQLQADVLKVVGGRMPRTDELSFDTIKNLFVAIGGDTVVGLLEMVRDVVLRAIKLLGGMIDVMHAALFAKISFPFVEKLVELVEPGAHLDTSFRLIDAIMLLASIPATITYKLIFNKAPFQRGQQIDLPFGRVSVQSPLSDFLNFAPLLGAFCKMAKGIYASIGAMMGDFAVTKVAVVGGVAFGAVGIAAQIFGKYEQEGSTVSALEWAAIGAGAFALVVSIAMGIDKWGHAAGNVMQASHKIDAGFDIVGTAAQVGISAAIFGIIIDKLRKSSSRYDQARQMPESFRWIALLLDQVGTIVTDAAVFVPLAAVPIKVALVGVGAATKGGSLAFTTLAACSTKFVLEPLKPNP